MKKSKQHKLTTLSGEVFEVTTYSKWMKDAEDKLKSKYPRGKQTPLKLLTKVRKEAREAWKFGVHN